MNEKEAAWNHPEKLQALAEAVLAEAKKQGATACELEAGVHQGFTVTARCGAPEKIEHHRDKSLEITVYRGQRMGGASLTDFSPEARAAAVRAALNIAKFTDEDPCAGLADPGELARTWRDPELYHPWKLSVNEALDLAISCEKTAFARDRRIENSEGTTVSTSEAWDIYANSHGFVGTLPASRHDVSCSLVARSGEDMQRGYSYTVSCDASRLVATGQLAAEAVERTVSRLGARKISTGHVPVIFLAEVARGLIGHFISAISGRNLYQKSSFLLDSLGQKLFPEHITIDERPHLPGFLGSSPFDSDGVATRENVFVEAGVLKSYIMGVYSARKLGLSTTGNGGGVHNLFVSTGQRDLQGLLKQMGKGLLVTELMGQGVNIITGDYSRGASGFWVENGEICYPVEEATIAGNLRDMYARMVEVGADVDVRGNIQTGSILIEEMMVAGE